MSKRRQQLERLRDLPDGELAEALDKARDDLFRIKLGLYTNQVENTGSVRAKRNEVAQILTIMKARELGRETQADGSSAAADGKEG